jgi:hypothetical protein
MGGFYTGYFMDGTFAVLTLVLGMYEAYYGCSEACLARNEVPSRISLAAGGLFSGGLQIGDEAYIRYDTGLANGPFQTIAGMSYSSFGDLWAGIGHSYTINVENTGLYAELHAMTGLYERGSGPDLGGPIEFRSGVEFGYEWSSGWRAGLSFDHRSNADLFASNPGIETIQFRISSPL